MRITRKLVYVMMCALVLSGVILANAAITECSRCHQETMEQDGPETIESYYPCQAVKEVSIKYTCTHCVNPTHSEYELVTKPHSTHEMERVVIETCVYCGEPTVIRVKTCNGSYIATTYEYPHQGCSK